MRIETWRSLAVAAIAGFVFISTQPTAAQYDPPAGYYNSATGTGATLKSQLATIMSSGHVQRSYGDFRFSAAISDRDPDNPNNILLVYNRESEDSAWNPGGTLPWNREHVWPVSRQPGSVSNNSTGNLGDPHALRPSDVQVNSNRGNDPFGFADTTGVHRTVGSYYFPGDEDKGDIARSLFYSSTRYNLALVNGFPGTNQMGDLESLLAWHYLDPPDDFERRRNHVIYSQAENPQYYTNNRNAFVDRPEYVWSVFVDQNNDTQLTLASGASQADGSSSLDVDLGPVIVGAALPGSQDVTLDKTGNDGTYYAVTATGDATSSVTGRHHAFAIGGSDARTFDIGIQGSTATPGTLNGSVTIDNLDVTTGLGSGFGALDGDDVVNVSLDVLAHANASFAAGSDTNELTLDFGTWELGDIPFSSDFSVFNLDSAGGLVADLAFDGVTHTAGDDVFFFDTSGLGATTAGQSDEVVIFSFEGVGVYSATYEFAFSDEDLPGSMMLDPLILNLAVEFVDNVAEPAGDFNASGQVEQGDLDLVLQNWGAAFDSLPAEWEAGRPTEGIVDQEELDGVLLNWGVTASPDFGGAAVPEPTLVWLGLVGMALTSRRARVVLQRG